MFGGEWLFGCFVVKGLFGELRKYSLRKALASWVG